MINVDWVKNGEWAQGERRLRVGIQTLVISKNLHFSPQTYYGSQPLLQMPVVGFLLATILQYLPTMGRSRCYGHPQQVSISGQFLEVYRLRVVASSMGARSRLLFPLLLIKFSRGSVLLATGRSICYRRQQSASDTSSKTCFSLLCGFLFRVPFSILTLLQLHVSPSVFPC